MKNFFYRKDFLLVSNMCSILWLTFLFYGCLPGAQPVYCRYNLNRLPIHDDGLRRVKCDESDLP